MTAQPDDFASLPTEDELSHFGSSGLLALGVRSVMRLAPKLPIELYQPLERLWTAGALLASDAEGSVDRELVQSLVHDRGLSETGGATLALVTLIEGVTDEAPAAKLAPALQDLQHGSALIWGENPGLEQGAVESDLRRLERFDTAKSSKPISPEFFAARLWPQDDELEGGVLGSFAGEWERELTTRGGSDLAERYFRLVRGDGPDWRRAAALINSPPTPFFEQGASKLETQGPIEDPEPAIGDSSRSPSTEEESRAVAMRMLADQPISSVEDDRFRFRDYADALVGLIDGDKTKTPLTLAINARWGVGKSSLGNMVIDLLRRQTRARGPRHVICQYNAWLHDEADDLTPAFIAHVARTANRHRPGWRRLLSPIPTALFEPQKRLRARVRRALTLLGLALVLSLVGTLLWYWLTHFGKELTWTAFRGWSNDCMENLVETASVLTGQRDKAEAAEIKLDAFGQSAARGVSIGLLALLWQLKDFFFGAARKVADFVANPEGEAKSGSLPVVRRQLHELLEQACRGGSRRFVIFIDDLERCRPPRAVDLLEAVNQLVNRRGVVTVVMADMPAVAAHVEIKYANLAERYDPRTAGSTARADKQFASRAYGRNYLQKIIQLQFDLPELQSIDQIRKALAPEKKPESRREPLPRLVRATLDSFLEHCWRKRPNLSACLSKSFERWDGRLPMAPLWVVVGWFVALPGLLAGLIAVQAARLLPWGDYAPYRATPNRLTRSAAILTTILVPVALLAATFLPGGFWPDLAIIAGGFALLIASLVLAHEIAQRVKGYRQMRRSARMLRQQQEAQPQLDYAATRRRLAEGDPKLEDFLSSFIGETFLKQKHLAQLGEESSVLEAAEELAAEFMPPIPRHVKRFHNRLRLLLYIGDLRQMFGQDRENEARRMGKWAVMQELWPELTQTLAHAHGEMGQLEDAEQRADTLTRLAPQYVGDALLERLLEAEPSLAGHVKKLTRFDEATATATSVAA